MSGASGLERAIAALKGGRAVRIEGSVSMTILAVETASAGMLALADPDSRAPLLISGRRAAALSLANRRDAADPGAPVLIERAAWLNPEAAKAIVDPARDADRAPLGPLAPVAVNNPGGAAAALKFARLAGLLPALWIVKDGGNETAISSEEIVGAGTMATLAARARLPLDGMPDTQVVVFRASDGEEHVALLIGAFGGEPPLVRLHSECLTGDVFGSLKCDCGPQLKEALKLIAKEGGGVLLYLRQEGRGIGIANKIRAYSLQDRGFDTVDANLRLGFDDDERDYEQAAAILHALGIDAVRLLTNNPAKVAGLEEAGVRVTDRIGHHMPTNPHNADYLTAKREKSGHIL